MCKYLKNSIITILLLSLVGSQIYPSYAQENLGAWLLSDRDPMRSTKTNVASKIKPGAIGNGLPLVDLLKGHLPEEVTPENPQIYDKLRESINLAIELAAEKKDDFDKSIFFEPYKRNASSALHRLTSLLNNLEDQIYFYHAPVMSPENYLLGFSYYSNYLIGLDVDLVEKLYAISPKRLAQYIYHECVPEHLVAPHQRGEAVDRWDHQQIYKEIQGEIFGKDEVEALKQNFRGFIEKHLEGVERVAPYESHNVVDEEKLTKDLFRLIEGFTEIIKHGDREIPPSLNKFSFIKPVRLRNGYFSGMYNIYNRWEFNVTNHKHLSTEPQDLLLFFIGELGEGVSLLGDEKILSILEAVRGIELHNEYRKFHTYNRFLLTLLPHIKNPEIHHAQSTELFESLVNAPENSRSESIYDAVMLGEFLERSNDPRSGELLSELYKKSPEGARGMLYPLLASISDKGLITKEHFMSLKRPDVLTMEEMFNFVAGRTIKVVYSEDDEDCPHNQFCYTVMVYGADGRIICEGGINVMYRVFDTEKYKLMGSPKGFTLARTKDWISDTGRARTLHTQNLVRLLGSSSEKTVKRAITATAIYIYEGQIDLGIDYLLSHYPGAPFKLKLNILKVLKKLDTEYSEGLIKEIIENEKNPEDKYFLEKAFSQPESAQRLVSMHTAIKQALRKTSFPHETQEFDLSEHETDVIEASEKLTSGIKDEAYQYFVTDGQIDASTFEEYLNKIDMYLDKKTKNIFRWAVMFHDIGKGRGLDAKTPHPGISAQISEEILPKINIGKLDANDKMRITWLVKNHDILGNIYTAERAARWLNKESQVFAPEERKKMLFLLGLITLSDMKGTRGGMFLSDEKAKFYLSHSRDSQIAEREAMLEEWRIKRWTGKIDGTFRAENENKVLELIDKSPQKEKIKAAFGKHIGYVANAFYTVIALSPEELVSLMEKVSKEIPGGMEELSLEFTKPSGNPTYMVDELKKILRGESHQELKITFDATGEKEGRIIVDVGSLKTEEEAALRQKEQAEKEEFFTSPKIMARAQLLKNNIMSLLEKDPKKTFIIAIDTDIAANQHAQIMALLRVVDQLKRMKTSDGKPAFPNLKVVRKSGKEQKLHDHLIQMFQDGEDKTLDLENVLMVVSDSNYTNNEFPRFTGLSWISVIYDSPLTPEGESSYLPLLEAVTLTAMAALKADLAAVKGFFDTIAYDPVTLMPITETDLEAMLRNRTILIMPKMDKIPINDLTDLYKITSKIYLAA